MSSPRPDNIFPAEKCRRLGPATFLTRPATFFPQRNVVDRDRQHFPRREMSSARPDNIFLAEKCRQLGPTTFFPQRNVVASARQHFPRREMSSPRLGNIFPAEKCCRLGSATFFPRRNVVASARQHFSRGEMSSPRPGNIFLALDNISAALDNISPARRTSFSRPRCVDAPRHARFRGRKPAPCSREPGRGARQPVGPASHVAAGGTHPVTPSVTLVTARQRGTGAVTHVSEGRCYAAPSIQGEWLRRRVC